MPRRLYYRDRYGRLREARDRDPRRPGRPARRVLTVLLVLAAIIVIASLLQSLFAAARGPDRTAARRSVRGARSLESAGAWGLWPGRRRPQGSLVLARSRARSGWGGWIPPCPG